MMPGNLFHLELAGALGDRRRLVLRAGISLLLALPFLLVDMPAHARAAGLTMIILFTGFFGAAVHHARLRADGRLVRLYLLPMRRSMLWLDLALASMLARLAPAFILLACFVLVGRGGSLASLFHDLAGATGLLCGALLLLTLLGMAVGSLARSNGEVHLFGALTAMVVAATSGIAPLPERLAWVAATAPWNPISRLPAALTALADGRRAMGPVELGVALLVPAAITAATVLRWTSGCASYRRSRRAIDNEIPMEVRPE